jgi:nicotinate phosphoribosyltransferase
MLSLLDNDLYKFTMQQFVFHKFKDVEVKYKFYCRNKNILFNEYNYDLNELELKIEELCELTFDIKEIKYLKSLEYFKEDYLKYLKKFKLKKKNIRVELKNNKLEIIILGKWIDCILWEVPLLAIINELYFLNKQCNDNLSQRNIEKNVKKRLIEKIQNNKFNFVDFGTRRRYSFDVQNQIIQECLVQNNFLGTSNLYFAELYNLKPIGTMAHEVISSYQVLAKDKSNNQNEFFKDWNDEYKNSIMISDTLTTNYFIKNINRELLEKYNGVRLDSGDPFDIAEKIIYLYNTLNINTKDKMIIFSDNLNFNIANELNEKFANKINCLFAIGTNLTNDTGYYMPINIVIKLIEVNNYPVAKLSDNLEKEICEDVNHLNNLKKIILK